MCCYPGNAPGGVLSLLLLYTAYTPRDQLKVDDIKPLLLALSCQTLVENGKMNDGRNCIILSLARLLWWPLRMEIVVSPSPHLLLTILVKCRLFHVACFLKAYSCTNSSRKLILENVLISQRRDIEHIILPFPPGAISDSPQDSPIDLKFRNKLK